MSIFDWLFGNKQAEIAGLDPALVRQAVDYLLQRIDPRLMLVRDYQARLMPPMAAIIQHLRGIVDALPEPRPCDPEHWSQDVYLRSFFAAPDSLAAAVNRSLPLREFFQDNPSVDVAHALLGMAVRRKQVFGVALKGELMQHDVEKTVWAFDDHKLRFIGADAAALRRSIGAGVLEQLAQYMLEHIEGEQEQRNMLEQERAALKTRAQLLLRQGRGMDAMLGDTPPPNQAEQERIQQLLDENSQALQQMGAAHEALERYFAHLLQLLGEPEQTIPVHRHSVILDQMNNEVAADAGVASHALELSIVQTQAEPPQERTFILVKIRREQLSSSAELLDDALKML
ncbi:MAG: hypothetical protein ACRCZ5_06055 [Burkholderiales bacterium]